MLYTNTRLLAPLAVGASTDTVNLFSISPALSPGAYQAEATVVSADATSLGVARASFSVAYQPADTVRGVLSAASPFGVGPPLAATVQLSNLGALAVTNESLDLSLVNAVTLSVEATATKAVSVAAGGTTSVSVSLSTTGLLPGQKLLVARLGSLTYTYDGNGNRASLTEGATTFGYAYDAMNRLKQADAFGGSFFFEYDAAGRRTSLLRPNGIRTTWAYDDGNQVTAITHAKGDNVVLGFAYEYDFHGMRTSKTREDGTKEVYGYDAADRLVQVDYGTSRRVQYGLDPLGNRALEDTTAPGQPLVRDGGTFNGFNQLMTTGGPGSTFPLTNFVYDLNGNLISETKHLSGLPDEMTAYGWDRDNRLKSVSPPIGTLTTYRYDANGLRTERVDMTGTTRYLLDGPTVLEELDGTNAAAARYFSNLQRSDEVLSYQRPGSVEYPLTDALGSIYVVSDNKGTIVHRYDFGVFGERTDLGGSTAAIDAGYTGRWHDPNGLLEHRDRQRNPKLGGWLQPDRLNAAVGDAQASQTAAFPMPTAAGRFTADIVRDVRNVLSQRNGHGRDGKQVRLSVRDYDAEIGRWTAKDLTLFDGRDANSYAYALNNPLYWTDPTGLYVYNHSNRTIWVKPEKGDEPRPLLPYSVDPYEQDGIADPAHPGYVYKSIEWVDIIIYEDGSAVPFSSSGLVSLAQVLWGGWKDEQWLQELHKKGDNGWDKLFGKSRIGCP